MKYFKHIISVVLVFLVSTSIVYAATTVPVGKSGTNEYLLYTADSLGIGTTTPAGKLEIINTGGGTTPSNYLQITGSIVDNANYPGFQLKGGTLVTTYPRIQLDNGGLNLDFFSGSSGTFTEGSSQIFNSSTAGQSFIQWGITPNGGSFTEKMRLTGAGFLGIGSSTPWATLSVQGSAAQSGPVLSIATTSSSFASSTALIVDQNGLVGIGGVTVPTDMLTVGNSAVKINFGIGTGNAGAAEPQIYGNAGVFLIGANSNTVNNNFARFLSFGGNTWFEAFKSNGAGVAPSTSGFVISSGANGDLTVNNGNIGISTSTPSFRVDIDRSANGAFNMLRTTNRNTGSSATGIMTMANFDGTSGLVFENSSNAAGPAWQTGTNDARIYTAVSGSKLYLSSNNNTATPDLTISNTKLGLGSTTPYGTLSVMSNNNPAFVLATTTGKSLFRVDNKGNQNAGGDTPTVSCAPSGGTVAGGNNGGAITTGTLSTACTVTFADGGFPSGGTMYCTVSDNSTSINFDVSAISNTAVTFSAASALTGTLYYHCGNYLNN